MTRPMLAAATLALILAALLFACSSGPSTARGFVAEVDGGDAGGGADGAAGDGAAEAGADAPINTACCAYPASYVARYTGCPFTFIGRCGAHVIDGETSYGNVECEAGGCVVNGEAGTLTTCPICSGVYAALGWDDAGLIAPVDAGVFTTGPDGGVYSGLPGIRQCASGGGSGGIVDSLVNEDTNCETASGGWPTSMVCLCAGGTSCAPTAPGADLDGGYVCQ